MRGALVGQQLLVASVLFLQALQLGQSLRDRRRGGGGRGIEIAVGQRRWRRRRPARLRQGGQRVQPLHEREEGGIVGRDAVIDGEALSDLGRRMGRAAEIVAGRAVQRRRLLDGNVLPRRQGRAGRRDR